MNKTPINRLLNVKIKEQTMEDYIANMLSEAESKDVDLEKIKLQNQVLRQFNSHHREVNASYRIELRDRENKIAVMKLKQKLIDEIDNG